MPTLEYQCVCGLQYESFVGVKTTNKTALCGACGEMNNPCVPSQIQGHFNKQVTGPVPQNTGIHDLDAHIDRVIGQSARQGREVIHERVSDKREILRLNPGTSGHDLSRTSDGPYRVLAPEERGVHSRGQNIHNKALDVMAQNKKPRQPRGSR